MFNPAIVKKNTVAYIIVVNREDKSSSRGIKVHYSKMQTATTFLSL